MEGWLLGLAGLLLLLCASQVAVALVNAVVPLLATPRALPKMDLSEGIPRAARTLVVVPTMITSAQNVEHLVEALEVRFLGNRDDHVAFALLTDLADAPRRSLPEDEALERLAEQRISELNAKYGRSFFLFHRPRRWNPAGTRVDGIRAQAREAGRPERAAPRPRRTVASRSSSATPASCRR